MSIQLRCPVCCKPITQAEYDKALGLWGRIFGLGPFEGRVWGKTSKKCISMFDRRTALY